MNNNTSSRKKEFGDFVFGKTLGEGTFGKVKLGKHKVTGENIAIKVLEKSKISDIADTERVLREIHILKLMRHPNIVQLYDIGETNKKLFLFMEYMENGELFEYIVDNQRLREDEACRLFHQLIDGIEHLHKLGIVHRDLKPENLLLDFRKNLRIVDFGLSNTYKKDETLKTACGSPCYAAPEMLNGQAYHGLKVDIWSSGVILFAMLCGFLPFEDNDNTSLLYKKILAGDYKIRDSISEPAKDLIRKILCVDQNKRYTIEEIRKHPWMTYNCSSRTPAKGIVVGYNKIPVDEEVLNSLKAYSYDIEHTRNSIETNRHSSTTTTYYLSLKKHIRSGGKSPCDFWNPSFDPSILEPMSNTRKSEEEKGNLILIESFFTNNNREEHQRRKSKQNLRDRSVMRSKGKQSNKQNRIANGESSKEKVVHQSEKLISGVKKVRTNSKVGKIDPRIENSINYGRPSTGKSSDKPKRENHFENRLSRKYKEKFNQSLVSKSKDKISHQASQNQHFQPKLYSRPRIQSSVLQSKTGVRHNETGEMTELIQEMKQGRRRSICKKIGNQGGQPVRARWV